MASSTQSESNNPLLTAAMSEIMGIHLVEKVDPGWVPDKLSLLNYHNKTYCYGRVGDMKESEAKNEIEIYVKSLNGDTFTIRIDPTTTVNNLKAVVQDENGILIDQQRLIFAGRQLEDERNLSECGINDGSVLHLVLRLRGGGCSILDPETTDPHYDYDFTHLKDENRSFTRGGMKYSRPCGWKRFAIKVSDKFGDSVWLGHTNSSGEWPVSYHGTGLNQAKTIAMDGYDLTKGKRFAFGHGVYSTPDIKVAEKYAKKFTYENDEYLVVLQNRVNPATLVKISGDRTSRGEYWINPSDKDVRPYGICIRKL